MNQPYQRAFVICLFIMVFLTCLLRFPMDDSLRHVGLAFGNFTSWGDAYPFSIFAEFKDYNPWFGYDLSLRLIASALKQLPTSFISLLTLKFLLTKTLSLLFALGFFYLVLVKSSLLDYTKDRDSFTLVLIILLAFLAFPLSRIVIARPFALGTFFLIYSADQKGIARGFLSSLVLAFFYPYLCWFYILPVAFAHLIKGDKKFALGGISFIILFLFLQPTSFWGFQVALVKSDIVRGAINAKIREFHSTLKFLPFYIYLAGFIIFYPKFSKDVRRLSYLNILILIYLVPALKYLRYFYDLTLPLLFISFGKELIQIMDEPYRKLIASWGKTVQGGFKKIKSTINIKAVKIRDAKRTKRAGPGRSLKPYITISYILIFAFIIHFNIGQIRSLKGLQDTLAPVPAESLILTSFNLQYEALYLRPDLQVIPSCEMGFAGRDISKEYVNFFNDGLIRPLSGKTGADYFLENRKTYVNPQDGKFLKLIEENHRFKLWKILYPKNAGYTRITKKSN